MSVLCHDISFSYTSHESLLSGLHFEAEAGSLLLIAGHNGAGKSTLLKLLNGILRPAKGRIHVNGREVRLLSTSELASEICVTFQHPADQLFASTVQAEAEYAPRNLKRAAAPRLASEALDLFGLSPDQDRHPYDLPGARRKLLCAAAAVASGAPVLAFDEPTAGLSAPERQVFANALRALRHAGKTVIAVSHDLEFFLPHSDRILILSRGRSLFTGPTSELPEHLPELRHSGVRLPLPIRLRPYAGLPLIPDAPKNLS